MTSKFANSRLQVAVFISDTFTRCLYQRRVKLEGVVFVWCESLDELLHSISGFSYDGILLELNGFGTDQTTLRNVRKSAPQAKIVAILNTLDPADVVDAFRWGVCDTLLVPATPEAVAWSMGKVLGSVRAPDNEDDEIFRTANATRLSDDPVEMRAKVKESIQLIVRAKGGSWITQAMVPNTIEPGVEYHIALMRKARPHFGFGGVGGLDPQSWFSGGYGWIPLREDWMGGLLLWGVAKVGLTALSRIEYLVRNLEQALENLKRYTEAKRQTYIDDLTRAYNARYLKVYGASRAQKKEPFAVLFIDVDRFKSVNDTHGHLVGSGLLVQMAKVLKNGLRPDDVLFRYGGDEFVIIINTHTREDAIDIAERLRLHVARSRFQVEGVEVQITISIGIALFPEDGVDERRILEMADNAMYVVKKNGRNSVYSSRGLNRDCDKK